MMYDETRQIAERVEVLLAQPLPDFPTRPDHLYSLARGSSDHAASVIQRFMLQAFLPMTTMPPSMLRTPLQMPNSAVVAISQSGASPDLCEAASQCKRAQVPVIAVVNQASSPLGDIADLLVQQQAGPENAVAATKSVVCSILTGALLANHWGAGMQQLQLLPEQILQVQKQSFDPVVELLKKPGPIIVIGRGSGLGIAGEVALKIQELLRRPAMAYSSAEVLHGPAGMIGKDFPVLALAVGPEAAEVAQTVESLKAIGADTLQLQVSGRNDVLAPVVTLCWLYLALEAACVSLGLSPDKPVNLNKVTLTR